MAYVVKITARAERDLALLFAKIRAEHSATALKWYRGLKAAILSLEAQPTRWPVTHESANLRHLLYGQKADVYRVVYRVSEKRGQVDVLHIRHGGRRRFRASDVA
ncbi:MAG TPA: type II toxin-antitoxin system RelE/ParE family toxin [Bryobacteraceae bacterium]|nr:type II toxin-antitoxin system RelE/ParE family toxin [Bryobacteraceae bacterium]